MTEQVNEQSVESNIDESVNVNEQAQAVEKNDIAEAAQEGSSEQASDGDSQAEEKLIPQSKVDELIVREKRRAAERARREAQEQLMRQNANQQAGDDQAPQNFEGMTPAQIAKAVEQNVTREMYKRKAYEEADKIAQSFRSKMEEELVADPKFADLYHDSKFEYNQQFAPIVLMANELPNTGKVVKDIISNPSKFANVLMLANSGSPALAKRELSRLSKSIEQNEAALKQKQAPAPLSQVKPSGNSTGDGSNMSVSEMRRNLFNKSRR